MRLRRAFCLQGVKLSAKEQRELDYKIRVYELAKKRKEQEDALKNRDEYRMPDSYDDAGRQDERMQLLTKRFECDFLPFHSKP